MRAPHHSAPSLRTGRGFYAGWFLILPIVFAMSGNSAEAQTGSAGLAIEPIPVDVDRRDTWPDGEWVPILGRRLNELARQTEPGPPAPRRAWIEEAMYTATFDGSNLRGGRLKADVRFRGERAEVLSLEPLSLAVLELHWGDREATWGTLGDGRTALLVDGAQKFVEGTWSLAGRKLPGSVEFDVRIPSAAVSRIRLTLPQGYVATSTEGASRLVPASAEGGLQEWELNLGSQTRCRIAIRRRLDQAKGQPLVLFQTKHSYVVREDGIQLQSDFDLEAVGGPIDLLLFDIPAAVNVYSVTYGNDSALTWRLIDDEGGGRLLATQLPDAIEGNTRSIRISGTAASRPGRIMPLEQPELVSAEKSPAGIGELTDDDIGPNRAQRKTNTAFLNGQLYLKVESPLQMRSIEANGFRQTATVSASDVSRSLSFQQYLPEARLKISAAYPELRGDARVATYIDTSQENWSMTALVGLSTRAGTSFEAECRMAPLWEVIEVRALDAQSELTNWTVRRQRGGVRTLSIEFREAIEADSPKGVEIVARLPVSRNRPLRLPLLRPLKQRSIEQLIAVSHPAFAVRGVEAAAPFKAVGIDGVPDFAKRLAVWRQIESSNGRAMLFLHSTDAAGDVRLQLEPLGPAIDAGAWVAASFTPSGIHESARVEIVPQGEAIGRVLVYLSGESGESEWRLHSPDGQVLTPARLPVERHGDWDLPGGGSLWEIQLPQPLSSRFSLFASRIRPVAASAQPMLAFVPEADRFRGVVELQARDGIHVDVTADGLAPVKQESLDPVEYPEVANVAANSRLWMYRTPQDALLLRKREGASRLETRNTATLHLRSILSHEFPGFDRHSATFTLRGAETFSGEGRWGGLQFELMRPAELLSATVDGEAVSTRRDGNRWTLLHAGEPGETVVQLEYQSPSSGGRFEREASVPVPRFAHSVLRFRWEFATPPDDWVLQEPAGMTMRERLPQLSWTERFFGPLGRPVERAMFNPFSAEAWTGLVRSDSPSVSHDRSAPDDRFSPPGWTIHRAEAPYLPDELTIATRGHSQARLLAWLGTLGCLLCGLLMRIRNWNVRTGIFGYWLSGCLFAAWLSPPFFALIAGGCIVGTVVSLLFPRRLLERLRFRDRAVDPIPQGSTASFRGAHVSPLLLLLTGLLTTAYAPAQETPQPARPPAPATGSDPAAALPQDKIRVLFSNKSGGRAYDGGDVVYVEQSALAKLLERARSRGEDVGYVVSSADYRARVDGQNASVVEARYTVLLLPSVRSAHVKFPSARGNPGDCRVNGRPQPIVLSENGEQFYVDLTSPGVNADPGEVSRFDVALDFRPATGAVAGGHAYRLDVIPVASARLRQEFAELQGSVEAVGTSREVLRDENAKTKFAYSLGKTDGFQVLWSANAEPVQPPGQLEAAVTTQVIAHPTWLDVLYRVDYRVLRGQVDFVAWQLPHEFDKTVVRDVLRNGEPVAEFSRTAANRRSTRLLVQFAAPQRDDFTIEARVVVPLAANRAGEISIPLGAVVETSQKPALVAVTQNLLGISAPPEFQFTAPLPEEVGESVQEISIETFHELSGISAMGRLPVRTAYEVKATGGSLPMTLTAATPLRTVRMIQSGVVRGSVLHWTLTAELGSSRAPVFRHRLRVPPELEIGRISVREDEAERLVHWTPVGNAVELFLSDRSTGIQSISLEGELRLPPAVPMALPLIDFEQADVTDSKLRLYAEPNATVELVDASGLEAIVAAAPPGGSEEKLQLLGQFYIVPDVQLPRIQLGAADVGIQAEAIYRIRNHAGGQWEILYDFAFQSDAGGGPLGPVSIRIPPELAGSYRIEAADAELIRDERHDGSIRLDCNPNVKTSTEQDVRILATVDEPPAGEWRIPQIEVERAVFVERSLLIPPDVNLRPVGTTARRLLPRNIPPSTRRRAEIGPLDNDWQVYALESGEISLLAGAAQARPPASRVPLLETRITSNAQGETFGQTSLWILNRAEDELLFAWPAGLTFRGLSVDGRSVVVPRQDAKSRQLAIPLVAHRRASLIVLDWSRQATRSPAPWSSDAQVLPVPRGLKVERSIVSIVPPHDAFYAARGSMEVVDPADYALERLEGLRQLCETKDGSPPVRPIWAAVIRQQVVVERMLSADESSPGGDSPAQARRERFNRISEAIAEFQALYPDDGEGARIDAADGAFADGETADLAAAAPNRSLLFARLPVPGKSAQPVVSFWSISHWAVAGGLLLIGLPLIPVVRRIVKMEIGPWLFRHQPAAWAMLGILWWTCLRPGELGLLLLLVSAIVAVRDRRRPHVESEFIINVTDEGSVGSATHSR